MRESGHSLLRILETSYPRLSTSLCSGNQDLSLCSVVVGDAFACIAEQGGGSIQHTPPPCTTCLR